MFAFNIFTILAAATAAFSHPAIHSRATGGCSTGTLQCCDTIVPAGSKSAGYLSGTLPFNLQGLNAPIGSNCIPVSESGAGSSGTCSAQTSCCRDVANNGQFPVGINCSPFNSGF